MKVALVGAVFSTEVALGTLRSMGVDVSCVFTIPRDRSRRHSDYVDLHDQHPRVLDVIETNTSEFADAVAREGVDLTLVIGWSRFIHPALLDGENVLGYHPAPLPLMRGRGVIPWTILLDCKRTGGTIFRMNESMDAGPMLTQCWFDVGPRENATTLYAKHMRALESMLRKKPWEQEAESQREFEATYCSQRKPEDGRIDWAQSAVDIDRLVRATTHPYPGAYTTLANEPVVIWDSNHTDSIYHGIPGQVQCSRGGYSYIMCGDGRTLEIKGDYKPGVRFV